MKDVMRWYALVVSATSTFTLVLTLMMAASGTFEVASNDALGALIIVLTALTVAGWAHASEGGPGAPNDDF